MEDIFNNINTVKNTVNNLNEEKISKDILNSIVSILESLAVKTLEQQNKQKDLEEYLGYIGEDLSEIQEELFEELTLEELCDSEEEYTEINCKNCKKPLFIEKDSINKNTKVPCPFCDNDAN